MFVCDHELTLNGLRLHGQSSDLQAGRFTFDVSADDEFEFGSHEAVTSVVEALWADGSRVTRERADNAVTTISVLIEGDTLTDLAAGEAALRKVFPGPDESVDLVWRPGDGAPAAVRTVLDVDLAFDSEDLEVEGEWLQRVFTLTLTHAPFVRSEFETVVPALPTAAVPTTVAIDSFSSASGWSGSTYERPSTSSAAVSGGKVRVTVSISGTSYRARYNWRVRRTGASIDFSSTPYLIIEHQAVLASSVGGYPMAFVNNHLLPAGRQPIPLTLVRSESTADGWTRSVFRCAATDVTSIDIWGYAAYPTTRSNLPIDVRRLERSSSPTSGSRQALARTLDIGGTERTAGALRITGREVWPLGTVIVHTCPDLGDGYTPELLDGTLEYTTRTAGDNAPSSYWYAGAVTTTVPAARFAGASYTPMVWVKSANSQSVKIQAVITSKASAASTLQHVETLTSQVSFAAGEVRAVPLAPTTFPGVRSNVGTVKVAVSAPGAIADSITIGGLWAYRGGRDCALSIFTTDQPYAWLTPESLAAAEQITVSDVDSIAAGWDPGGLAIQSLESHILPAGRVLTNVVTGRVQDADVSYRYTKAWPLHPADDGSQP